MTKALAFGFTWVRVANDDYDVMELRTSSINVDADENGTTEAYDSIADTATDVYSNGNRDRLEIWNEINALFKGVEDHYHIRVENLKSSNFSSGPDWIASGNSLAWSDGRSFSQVVADNSSFTWDEFLGENTFNTTGNIVLHVVVKNSIESSTATAGVNPTGDFPSVCNNSLVVFRWDGANDVDVLVDPEEDGGVWVKINGTAVTTQAELKTFLETIYPNDDYKFAYHVNTGHICVEWEQRDVGSGTFTFDVDLQENILVDDDVEAWIARKQEDNQGKWF